MSAFEYGQDPAEHTAKEVVEWLENADITREQYDAVQQWEAEGKARTSIARIEYANGDEEDETGGFDLTDMREIAPEDMAKAPRTGRTAKPNPLDPYMQKSYEEDRAFEKVLENDKVKDFVSKVRRSATAQGYGSKVRLMVWNADKGEAGAVLKSEQESPTGKTLVQFQATDKRERSTEGETPDQETAENTAQAGEYATA